MTPEVEAAIEGVRRALPNNRLDVEPDPDGGAFVIVHDLSVGPTYEPETSWVGFQITFQYPRADVYPHFLDGNLRRRDRNPLGQSFSGPTQWRDRQAIQVSRRSNRLDPALDTAATKLVKVLEWVRSR